MIDHQQDQHIGEEKTWYGKTLKGVLLKPYQFSCFNRNDPNLKKMFKPKPRIWKQCFKAAWNAYAGLSADPTLGANHYCRYDISPSWRKIMELKKRIGNHMFFKSSPGAILEWWYAKNREGENLQLFLNNYSMNATLPWWKR